MAHLKPKLNPVVQTVIWTARVISPQKDADWFDDMHYELGFVDGLAEQLKFSLSSLGLALQLRAGSVSWSSPRVLTLTGVGAAALFAFFIFVPQTLQKPIDVALNEPSPVVTEGVTLTDDSVVADTIGQAAGTTLNSSETDLTNDEDVIVAAQADRSVTAEAPVAAAPAQNSSGLAARSVSPEPALEATSELSTAKTNTTLLLISRQERVTVKALADTRFTLLVEGNPLSFTLNQDETQSLTVPLEFFIEDLSTIELFTDTEQFDLSKSKDANTVRIDISE